MDILIMTAVFLLAYAVFFLSKWDMMTYTFQTWYPNEMPLGLATDTIHRKHFKTP